MPARLNNRRNTIWQTYGKTESPETIRQEAFHGDDRHLKRLARLQPGDQPETADIWEYASHDLRYTEIQSSLLAHVLPFFLEAWREDLLGVQSGYGGLIEHLYPVLADCHVFDVHLIPRQAAAAAEFIRQTILEEIDNQQGLSYEGMNAPPYRWIRALTTYGVLLPDIDRLWATWWSLDTPGRAIAMLQYVSCLMYEKNENPVFKQWTPNGGGGPPSLWEFEGHLYSHRWLEPNVQYLRTALTLSSVRKALSEAVQTLASCAEHEKAERLKDDLLLLDTVVEARCKELAQILGTVQNGLVEWSI